MFSDSAVAAPVSSVACPFSPAGESRRVNVADSKVVGTAGCSRSRSAARRALVL